MEQIKDYEQTATLAFLLGYAKDHYSDGKKTIPEIAAMLYEELQQNGYSGFSDILIFREAMLFQGFRRSTPA